ncbi:glucosamine-6-phosphate deaminase [Devosia sp. 2618]|uniref:glucosamine-6-phosphate deaminase n=1 Tax=Devosia sp. 2618 TaxID=3156454 RepID=UPI003396D499
MTEPTITTLEDAAAVSSAVAQHVAQAIQAKPKLTLGLATGNTFRAIYADLVALYEKGGFSLAQAKAFNLDEYVGLAADHPASFATYMKQHLFNHVDFAPGAARLPEVAGGDIAAACAAYEQAIATAGGIDLQLLGIGRNGHIGFNEPGSPFDSRTREVALTASTQSANAVDFPPGEAVPPTAATMGIGSILDAREIVLVVTGAHKAEALHRAFHADPSIDCPASALHRHHNVHVFCDKAAAGL